MKVEKLDCSGFEEVIYGRDSESHLEALIAVHNTARGPSLGGVRVWPYSSFDDALHDVLRLAEAMTYKAAVADLPLGGGKAVIILGPQTEKNAALFQAFGRLINVLEGKYITAEDVGTNEQIMDWIGSTSRYVTGGSNGYGDPSPHTARGVVAGMKASLKVLCGSDSLAGRTIAIQGVGNVGSHIARLCAAEGARLFVSDIDASKAARVADETDAETVAPEEILYTECDILCPAALGGVINARNIERLNCTIVAGAANNILEDELRDAKLLAERNILFVPDYVINAGGLINVGAEWLKWPQQQRDAHVSRIGQTVAEVITRARREGRTPVEVARDLARERLAEASGTKS